MVNTFTYNRRKKLAQESRERAAAQRLKLFNNASIAMKRGPLRDIDSLSLEGQLGLLQAYVARLDKDIALFTDLYPDDDGRSSAVLIKRQRVRALDEIANLMVGISRGDEPMGVIKG